MKNKLLLVALIASLGGCAATYVAPTATATVLNQTVKANKTDLLKATSVALALDGIKISSENKDTGIIVTEDKVFRVTPEMADCGTTMGIDYLKDNRTNTKVSYHIIVSDNSLKIKASPSAEYRVGGTVQDLNLTCVSKGILEQRLYESIIQNL
ncbi:hypothetical protein F9K57_03225 [Acinetobacter baumannii]|nr:hypothetical protein F9K57_03225 [Acinetobacter baumannii]